METDSRKIHGQGRRPSHFGQSMVEAAVALGIVVTAVTSALTLVTSAVKAEKESEFAIIGGNLAREGIEAVRAIRDSNWLAGDPFDKDLVNATESGDCSAVPVFDPTAQAAGFWSLNWIPGALTDGKSEVWRYTTGDNPLTPGLFAQDAGDNAKPDGAVTGSFQRLLTLQSICVDPAGDEMSVCGDCVGFTKIGIRVRSDVAWNVGDRPHRLSVEEWIYDWR